MDRSDRVVAATSCKAEFPVGYVLFELFLTVLVLAVWYAVKHAPPG